MYKRQHQDFHGALSTGLCYLEEHFGADAVREYLRQFALTFYAPVTRSIKERGLIALREEIERVHELEGGGIRITGPGEEGEDEMLLEVQVCPAIRHMRKQEYSVAPLFYETCRTVYAAICQDTPFASDWLRHDEQRGQCAVRFYRKQP